MNIAFAPINGIHTDIAWGKMTYLKSSHLFIPKLANFSVSNKAFAYKAKLFMKNNNKIFLFWGSGQRPAIFAPTCARVGCVTSVTIYK